MLSPNAAANPDRPASRPSRRRQRGLSLVELAIVLVVVGLILGGALIPAYQKSVDDDVERTRQRLDDIHAAIAGYAIRHRTPGVRYVVNVQEYSGPRGPFLTASGVSPSDRSTARTFWIPANRPYLPCPDYSGDGIENRLAQHNWFLSHALLQSLIDAKPVNTDDDTFQGEAFTTTFLHDALSRSTFGQNSLIRIGTCGDNVGGNDILRDNSTDRGALPWRTLGVPPSDKWGTRFTYRADQVYASALTGFGGDVFTDSYDPRVPMFYARGEGGRRLMSMRAFKSVEYAFDFFPRVSMLPSLVCGETRDVAGDGPATTATDLTCEPVSAGGPITGLSPDGPEIAGLLAGAVVTEETPWTPDNLRPAPFPYVDADVILAEGPDQAGSITEGVPYVLVSHGPNRSFGFNHRTLSQDLSSLADPHPCRWQEINTSSYNAAASFQFDPSHASPGEAHNSPCPARVPSVPAFGRSIQQLEPYLFLSQATTSAAASFGQGQSTPANSFNYSTVFDDIVEWRTRAQLNDLMTVSGVYPAEPLPLLITR